jgi:HK97 family phage prohead protease
MNKSFAFAEVKSATTDDPNGAFEAILSAPTTDRDNEIVQKGAFGNLPAHITIDVDHGLSMASTIGSGTPYYDGDLLKIKGTFSSIPRAQEARALVTEGHITTMSVAFLPIEKIKGKAAGDPTTITKAELLNAAFVAVPSNRDALVLSSKAGARNSKADAQHIQSMHDSAVSLGADCAGAKAATMPAEPAADPDEDPGKLAAAVDAALDEIVSALAEGDVASATDLATAAQATVDALLAVMGVPDADEATTRSAKPKDAAAAASLPADADDRERLALRARAMQYPVAV